MGRVAEATGLFGAGLSTKGGGLFSLEQNKKSSGLKIGIFTVFLVVAIITMLDSVISIVPILFVKLGQEEAGAIDF